jgi:flagellar export protein FliJ
MKPFRLATVERLRIRHLESLAQQLHAVGVLRERAVSERERLAERLAGSGGPGDLGTWTGADLDLANNFRQILRQQIQEHQEQIDQLDDALAVARTAWLKGRGEARAVTGLHDRYRVTVQAERARLDQRELDDLAGTRRSTRREPFGDPEPTGTEMRVR